VTTHVWREMVTDAYRGADEAWRIERDLVCIGYAEEEREFRLARPRPTLKLMMCALAGQHSEVEVSG